MSCKRAGFFLSLTMFALALGFAIVGCGGGGGDPAVIADTGPPVWVGAAGIRAVQTGDQMARVFFNQANDDDSPPVNFNVYYDTVTPVRFGAGAVKLTAVDKVQNAGGTGWLYDVTGLTNGTTYHFAVRTQDSAVPPNEDENDIELAGFVGDGAPPVWKTTAGVQFLEPGNQSVRVYWNEAEDAANPDVTYSIYYDTQSPVRIGGDAVMLADVETEPAPTAHDRMYFVEGLSKQHQYYFVVRARDSALPPNEDTNTVELGARPLDQTPPYWDTTVGIQSAVPGGEAARLFWNRAYDDDSPPAGFYVYYDTVSPIRFDDGAVKVEAETIYEVNGEYPNHCRLGGLEENSTYYVAVRARDYAIPPNEETNTVEMQVLTTSNTGPESPYGLVGMLNFVNPTQTMMQWEESPTPDTVSYRVYRLKGSPGTLPPYTPAELAEWDDVTWQDDDDSDTFFADGVWDGIPGANGFEQFTYVVTAVDHRDRESDSTVNMIQVTPAGIYPYILLVDNTGQLGAELDDSEDYEHRNALLELELDEGRDFEILTTSDYQFDQAAERDEFEEDLALDHRMLVIWFTANAFETDVVSEYQVGLLKDYLDGGGKLILDGDDILYSLWDNDQDEFLNGYLGVDTSAFPVVQDSGAANQTDLIGVTGGIFANWFASRGEPHGFEDSFVFDPSSGALEALAVNNWPAMGYELVATQKHDSQADSYLFMMSIGLEDIEDAAKREHWMLRIFNWMDVPLP